MTTSIARYDIHRAAAEGFNPADYRFIGAIDTDTSPFRADDSQGRKAIAAMEAEGFPYVEVHPYGQCDHCGQGLRYIAVMFHHPSASLIQVGLTCLGNRFASTAAEVKRMMAEAKIAREEHKLLDGFLAACDAHQDLAYATYAWNIEAAAPAGADIWGVGPLADIARKARQYGGDVSPKQLAFVSRILTQLDERFAEQDRRNAEIAAAKVESGPAPTGRVTIEGTVTKLDTRVNSYTGGERLVMTVTLDNGARVWGTVPAAIAANVEQGSRVAFTATFEQGEDDETFAFISRPSKASFIR
jgi:hypothetical protein